MITEASIEITASPTYELTVEPPVSAYYLSLVENRRELMIDHEEIRDCAGLPFECSMMVVDRLGGNRAAGIEIISPLKVTQAEERGGHNAIEITVGRDPGGDLVTIEDGISFDRSDEGSLPGVEVDYTRDGEVVAVRADRAAVKTSELL